MKIYLAGPMRGYPDNNSPAFAEATAHLRALGHEVWSPAEHDEKLGVDANTLCIRSVFRRDLEALLQQDAVVLLDGWNRSHGAALERHAADVVGMPVFVYTPRAGDAMMLLAPYDWRWRAS